MKFESKQIIEITGLVAVILSILLLTYELRQANQISTTQARFEITNSYAAMNEYMITTPAVAELSSKLRDSNFAPNDIEKEMIRAMIRRMNNTWLAVEFAYDNGQFPEIAFQGTLDDVRSIIRNMPAMHPYWLEFFAEYPSVANNYEVYSLAKQLIPNINN